MQDGLRLGWKREEESFLFRPCSDPRFDKPTLFLPSYSLTSQGYSSSIYECKYFWGQEQARRWCASRITHPLFHRPRAANTENAAHAL